MASFMIRRILFLPALFFFGFVFSVLTRITGLFDRSGRLPYFCGKGWSWWSLASAGITVETDRSAMAGLPQGSPVVFMPNHQSQLDILTMYLAFPEHQIAYVAKKSLFRIPVFGRALGVAGGVPIDRANSRSAMQSIDRAVDNANKGWSMVVFPEGTRSQDFSQLADFKIGGVILALKCGLPIVPVVIKGAGPLWPRGTMFMQPGQRVIRVKALAPIDTSAYTLKEREHLKNELYQRMNSAYLEM